MPHLRSTAVDGTSEHAGTPQPWRPLAVDVLVALVTQRLRGEASLSIVVLQKPEPLRELLGVLQHLELALRMGGL
jgi:hypothetical protein